MTTKKRRKYLTFFAFYDIILSHLENGVEDGCCSGRGLNTMKQCYIFEYQNENDFRKKERTLRKYNMFAFKKLTFEYYPEIRNGNFLGELVSVSKKDNTKSYELKLPTAELFAKVHGEIRLHYTVYEDKNIILLTNITPEGILDEGHRTELSTYKGVMISKSNPEKDMFKVNLMSMLQK